MAKGGLGGLSTTKVILLLTVVIAIGSVFTILSFLSTSGIIGEIGNLQGEFQTLSDQVNSQQSLDIEELLAQLPFDEGTTQQPQLVIEQPDGFTATDQDLISAFLDAIGITQTETFGIKADVTLVDANLEQQIESAFVRVQPLDPRTVILEPSPETDLLRFFINTDFSTQIADNGINFHKFSGWDIIQDFGSGASIPIVVTTTSNCAGLENTGVCIQVFGSKNNDDDVRNGSVLHGIGKTIDLSDWTGEGDLILSFDWDCNRFFTRGNQLVVNIKGEDFFQELDRNCPQNQKFTKEISEIVGNSNQVTVQIGVRVGNVDKFRADYKFNNVKIIGNSIIKRTATEVISLIDQLSIIQNTQEQRILDLGFIQLNLFGSTVFPNERVVLTGDFETRLNDKTVTQHQLTASGTTNSGGIIPIKIDGIETFFFKIDEQFYSEDSFQKLTFIVNNMIVNVGEGEELRTFEYHTPFTAYLLEFNVRLDEIVAFNEKDVAISIIKSDSTLKTCGLSQGVDPITQPEILPPVVRIIVNGFTLATTNPIVGKTAITNTITGEVQKSAEFCQTVPNLPRDTEITFKIENNFFEVASPITQANYFVKCTLTACSSNIGFSLTETELINMGIVPCDPEKRVDCPI